MNPIFNLYVRRVIKKKHQMNDIYSYLNLY